MGLKEQLREKMGRRDSIKALSAALAGTKLSFSANRETKASVSDDVSSGLLNRIPTPQEGETTVVEFIVHCMKEEKGGSHIAFCDDPQIVFDHTYPVNHPQPIEA